MCTLSQNGYSDHMGTITAINMLMMVEACSGAFALCGAKFAHEIQVGFWWSYLSWQSS